MNRPLKILVAGVGNLLLTDDGIGVHAVRLLKKELLPGITIADIGTAVLHGLHFLEEADRVLVIDAAKGGQPPGTVYLFDAPEPGQPGSMLSVHAMGLRQALCLLPPGRPAPAITVLGVEPVSLGFGMNLSKTVEAVLPRVVALARETVTSWLQTEQQGSAVVGQA